MEAMSPAAKSLFTADFRRGEFAKPFRVHAGVVPGTAVMTARRAAIRYEVFDQALEAHGTLPEAHRVREVTRLTILHYSCASATIARSLGTIPERNSPFEVRDPNGYVLVFGGE